MIKLCDDSVRKEILALLNTNIAKCLYLTIDLEIYGINSENVDFYYDKTDDGYNTIIMKYYDTVRLFSENIDYAINEYADFIKSLNPIAVCAEKSVIEKLSSYFADYIPEYGVVIADNKYVEFKQFSLVREAGENEAEAIADLMLSTEEFSQNNSRDVLIEQLKDRIHSGVGRSFVIEADNEIVAHTAIYAECSTAAVESGLVVKEAYKRKFYGMIIHEYLKKTLSEEGKVLYGLRYNDDMKKNAESTKINVCAECGRMIKKH